MIAVFDGLFTMCTLVACILSSIVLERGSRFEFPVESAATCLNTQFYSMGTFFSTFSSTVSMPLEYTDAHMSYVNNYMM